MKALTLKTKFNSPGRLAFLLFLNALGAIPHLQAQTSPPEESDLHLTFPSPKWTPLEGMKVQKQLNYPRPPAKEIKLSDSLGFQLNLESAAIEGSQIVLKNLEINLNLASAVFEKKPLIRVDCGALYGRFQFPEIKINLPSEMEFKILKKDSALWAQNLLPASDLKKLILDELSNFISGPLLAQNLQLQAQCPSPPITALLRESLGALLTQWDIRKEFETSADLEKEINKLELFKLPQALQDYASFIPDDFSVLFTLKISDSHWELKSSGPSKRDSQIFKPSEKVKERIQAAIEASQTEKNYGVFLSNSNLSWILEQSLAHLAVFNGKGFKTRPTENGKGLAYEWTLPTFFDAKTLKPGLRELRNFPDDKKLKMRLRTLTPDGKPSSLDLFPWISNSGLKRGWEITGSVVVDFLDSENDEAVVTYYVGIMTWTFEHLEDPKTGATRLQYVEGNLVQKDELSDQDLGIPGAVLLPQIWVQSLNFLVNRETQIDLVNEKFLSGYSFVVPAGVKLTWIGQATRSSKRPQGNGFRAQGLYLQIPNK